MPHANQLARQIWVGLLAIALLGACAPNRPQTQQEELQNGQQVSESAAASTHATDTDSLVLYSSSMDAGSGEAQADAQSADKKPRKIHIGLSEARTGTSKPDATNTDATNTDVTNTDASDAHGDTANDDAHSPDASKDISATPDIETSGAPK